MGVRAESYDPETDAGLIIGTDPRSGIAVARGTPVDYVVSLGAAPSPSPTPAPTELPVPDFSGLTRRRPRPSAAEIGLRPGRPEQETLDADPGTCRL